MILYTVLHEFITLANSFSTQLFYYIKLMDQTMQCIMGILKSLGHIQGCFAAWLLHTYTTEILMQTNQNVISPHGPAFTRKTHIFFCSKKTSPLELAVQINTGVISGSVIFPHCATKLGPPTHTHTHILNPILTPGYTDVHYKMRDTLNR